MPFTHGPALGFNKIADPKTGICVWGRSDSNGETVKIQYGLTDALGTDSSTVVINTAIPGPDGTFAINLAGLTPGTQYSYRLNGTVSGNGAIQHFMTLPASPVGKKIVFGSCISLASPGQTDVLSLLTYAKNIVQPAMWFNLGDEIYSEDVTAIWPVDNVAPPADGSHHMERFRQTYALAALAAMHAAIPKIHCESDHERMAEFPDDAFIDHAWSPGVNDPTTHACYASGKAAMDNYPAKFAVCPQQAGEGGTEIVYGRWVWGDYEIVLLDSRRWRRPDRGTILGVTQRKWFTERMLKTTAKFMLVFCGDPFAGNNSASEATFEENATRWYKVERDLIDSVAARSPAKVAFFGGDYHFTMHNKTFGGIDNFITGPYMDSLHRASSVPVWSQAPLFATDWEEPKGRDHRMGVITLAADSFTVTFPRANALGADAVTDTEYSVTVTP